jgi:hypothetical protein
MYLSPLQNIGVDEDKANIVGSDEVELRNYLGIQGEARRDAGIITNEVTRKTTAGSKRK